jgi:hypothetical protein
VTVGRTRQERERLLAALENPVPAGGVGPRVVQIPRNLLCIDPAAYVCSRLAGQLADEWVEYTAATALGRQTRTYRKAIDSLCRHVDAALGPAAEKASLSDADLFDTLVAWETALPEGLGPGSTIPSALASAMHLLIVRRDDHRDRAVAPALARLGRRPVLIGAGESTERDEFTRKEKRALVRAAWQSVHATRKRLDDGWALAATGRHPDQGSWTSIPDLLWGLAHEQITPCDMRETIPALRQWPAPLRALAARPDGTSSRSMARSQLCRRLVAQLYPTTLDLQAFRVLLMDATGHASEEVTAFGESDVEFLPKGVRLTLLKQRAGWRRHRAFRDQAPVAVAPGQDDEPDGPVTLDMPRREASEVVRQLLDITARVRPKAADITDTLFVHATVQSDYCLVFDRWNPNARSAGFGHWIEMMGVEIKGDRHIGRLRKSTKVEKAIVTEGRISAAADDHTEETFAGHYAQGTTLRIMSGRTIATAQQHWFDQALNRVDGPTIVADAESEVDSDLLQATGLSFQEAEDIMNGQLDMGVSHCRSPRQSPFGRPGELCPVAPLSCLECGNAWILPSNLPQLLLFGEHLERVRSLLPPHAFDKVWGQRWTNLRSVLADRTPTELAQAREHIETGRATLDLPLSAYTEFDA